MLDGRTKTDRYLSVFPAVRGNRRVVPMDQISDSRVTEVCTTLLLALGLYDFTY
jgi:hypothetical protein